MWSQPGRFQQQRNAINIPSFSSCTAVGLQLRSDLSGFSADLTDLSGAVQRVQGGLHICSPGKPRFPTARLPHPSGLERQQTLVNNRARVQKTGGRLLFSLSLAAQGRHQVHQIGRQKKRVVCESPRPLI